MQRVSKPAAAGKVELSPALESAIRRWKGLSRAGVVDLLDLFTRQHEGMRSPADRKRAAAVIALLRAVDAIEVKP